MSGQVAAIILSRNFIRALLNTILIFWTDLAEQTNNLFEVNNQLALQDIIVL